MLLFVCMHAMLTVWCTASSQQASIGSDLEQSIEQAKTWLVSPSTDLSAHKGSRPNLMEYMQLACLGRPPLSGPPFLRSHDWQSSPQAQHAVHSLRLDHQHIFGDGYHVHWAPQLLPMKICCVRDRGYTEFEFDVGYFEWGGR